MKSKFDFDESKKALAQAMIQSGAAILYAESFTLNGSKFSKYTINCAARCMRHILREDGLLADAIASIPEGLLIASRMARITQRNLICLSVWDGVGRNTLEVPAREIPSTCISTVIVNTLLTPDGSQELDAVAILKNLSAEPTCVITLVCDPLSEGCQALQDEGVEVRSVLTPDDLRREREEMMRRMGSFRCAFNGAHS